MFQFPMVFHYYSFASTWGKKKKCSAARYCEDTSLTFNKIRSNAGQELLFKGRWHMSCFGDVNFIENKLQSFSHQEFNNDRFNNVKYIMSVIENGTDLFNKGEWTS
jgi:hypothetical protein